MSTSSAFVLLAVAILFLIRAETRSRETRRLERDGEPHRRRAGDRAGHRRDRASSSPSSRRPLLPAARVRGRRRARARARASTRRCSSATTCAGPHEIEVLRVRTDAPTPPYLRATTLSRFDGGVWEPDRVRTVPLDSEYGARRRSTVDADVRVAEYTTTSRCMNLVVACGCRCRIPAVEVTGLDGRLGGRALQPHGDLARRGRRQGQTLRGRRRMCRGRRSSRSAPATRAGRELARRDDGSCPPACPPIIDELAARGDRRGRPTTTTGSSRCSAGSAAASSAYSLDAPVEEGFDGSGAEAVAQFLEVREGYCVHFASAFALMARTLDMPSRIVVGYLPGTADHRRASTSRPSTRCPARSCTRGPRCTSTASAGSRSSPPPASACRRRSRPRRRCRGEPDDPDATPTPRRAPTSTASARPTAPTTRADEALTGGAASARSTRSRRSAIVLGILLVLALPALVRERAPPSARCAPRAAATPPRRGRSCRMPRSTSASRCRRASRPRAFAARLVDEHGVSARRRWTSSSTRSSAPSYCAARHARLLDGRMPRRMRRASVRRRAARVGADASRRILAVARAAVAHRPPGQRRTRASAPVRARSPTR